MTDSSREEKLNEREILVDNRETLLNNREGELHRRFDQYYEQLNVGIDGQVKHFVRLFEDIQRRFDVLAQDATAVTNRLVWLRDGVTIRLADDELAVEGDEGEDEGHEDAGVSDDAKTGHGDGVGVKKERIKQDSEEKEV